MGRSHDGGGRAARRQACDIDPLRIDRIGLHDLARDARDQRRLPAVPLLVACAKPIPAFSLVGSTGLLRIDHEAISLFRQEIHPGAGREIVRRLGATVKHGQARKGERGDDWANKNSRTISRGLGSRASLPREEPRT